MSAFNKKYRKRKKEEEEERRKREEAGFPFGGLALAGLGGIAGYKLPDLLGNRYHLTNTLDAIDRFNSKQLPPNSTVMTDYEDVFGRAAQTNILGKPVGDLISGARKSPYLMDKFDMLNYGAFDPKKERLADGTYPLVAADVDMPAYKGAQKHYRAFREGPISSYVHQLNLKGLDLPVSSNPALGLNAVGADGKPLMYTDWMGQKFRNWLGSKNNVFPGRSLKGGIRPNEIDTDLVPHEDQVQIMRNFYGSLTPEEQGERVRFEGGIWPEGVDPALYNTHGIDWRARDSYDSDIPIEYDDQGKPKNVTMTRPEAGALHEGIWGKGTRYNVSNYTPIIKMVKSVQDNVLKPLGYGLMGVAGLYGAHKMHKYMRALQEKKEDEKEERSRLRENYYRTGELEPA